MILTHEVRVDWLPIQLERVNYQEIEDFIRDAIAHYNEHCGFTYFNTREAPQVESVKLLPNQEEQ